VKTAVLALAPLALTPLIAWLLMEFGAERAVIFAVYWIVPAIVFAIVIPIARRRGRSLGRASAVGTAWGLGVMVVVFVILLVASLFFVRPAVGSPIDGRRSVPAELHGPAPG
jgi:membrane protease YdiL (CAAX protease family)